MPTHAPPNYLCPFCAIARNEFAAPGPPGPPGLLTAEHDILLRTENVVAFIASHWWPNNPGHAIIIPTQHIENIYELTNTFAAHIHEATRQLAMAMKQAYHCPGTSTRQHNEPAGGQDVWHYQVHLFPRFHDDDLYANHAKRQLVSPGKRRSFGDILRRHLRSM